MDLSQMLQQAQKLHEQMRQTQSNLEQEITTSSVADGRIVVTANGKGEIQSLKISPEVVDPADVSLLEDLILSALKKAQTEAQQKSTSEVQKMASSMGLPPGFGF